MSRIPPKLRRGGRAGFNLIELLVVIAVIGVLLSILLPGIQAAREAARRAQCTNSLKQLALGVHNYVDAAGTLPMGGLAQRVRDDPAEFFPFSSSLFVAILPRLEQAAAFNALNFHFHTFDAANLTVDATGLSVLWCPSDS